MLKTQIDDRYRFRPSKKTTIPKKVVTREPMALLCCDAVLNFANFDLSFQHRVCEAHTKLVSAGVFIFDFFLQSIGRFKKKKLGSLNRSYFSDRNRKQKGVCYCMNNAVVQISCPTS